MVKAVWVGKTIAEQRLIVTPLSQEEQASLPEWVHDSIRTVGIAVHEKVAYAADEQTAREKLE